MKKRTPTSATAEQHDLETWVHQRESDRETNCRPILYLPAVSELLGGDVAAAVVISQIVYWHRPAQAGTTRMRVERDGHDWIAKSYTEWADECAVPVAAARRAIRKGVAGGFLIKTKAPFGYSLTKLHVRLDIRQLLDALAHHSEEQPSVLLTNRHGDAGAVPACHQEQAGMVPVPLPDAAPSGVCTEMTAQITSTDYLTPESNAAAAPYREGGIAPDAVFRSRRDSDAQSIVEEYRRQRPEMIFEERQVLRILGQFLEHHERDDVLRALLEADAPTANALNYMFGRRRRAARGPVGATAETAARFLEEETA